jgi:hypothetical protein
MSDLPLSVVVPLRGDLTPHQLEELDPWEVLARGEGLIVNWWPGESSPGSDFGTALAATSQFGRSLSALLLRDGVTQSSVLTQGLFTIELPTGSTLRDLVPAIGGGYRGMVRAGGARQIAGHVRMIPAGGAAVAGGASLGPVIAVMAVTVGAEMLARHQLEKKLATIHRGVQALRADASRKQVAELAAARKALQLSSAALLDQVSIPNAIGLGPARNNLRVIMQEGVAWLESWELGVKKMKIGKRGVDHRYLRGILDIEGHSDGREFAHRVAVLYEALALDARAEVLTSAEATIVNPGRSLEHLQRHLARSLEENAELQDRLREVLWQIAEPRLEVELPAWPSTYNSIASLDRTLAQLARAASRQPSAPAVLAANGRQVLEVVRSPDGSVQPVMVENSSTKAG